MATSYPGALDTLSNPTPTSDQSVLSHAGQHADANDAIEAIQAELGTDPAGSAATVKARLDGIDTHTTDTNNPHSVTKSQVGLGSVDNTSDADKPISTAAQAALDAKTTGPASSTDNALARFDGTTGKAVQNSLVTADDAGNLAIPGNLTISSASHARMYFSAPAGNAAQIYFQSGSSIRWGVERTSAPESGGDAGSDFRVQRLSDAGAHLGYPVVIRRATGAIEFESSLRIGGASGPLQLSGTGSPEGVHSAPVGSTYIREDGDTLGDIEYRKMSGSGNTGWVPGPACDTGWRDLTGETLANGWVSSNGRCHLRRIGMLVYFAASLRSHDATGESLYTLPVGFRTSTAWASAYSAGGVKRLDLSSSIGIDGYADDQTYFVNESFTVATNNTAWPTTLPGTAD